MTELRDRDYGPELGLQLRWRPLLSTTVAGPRIVTPEAVVLELNTAGLATRIGARMLDLLIQVAVAGILGIVLALASSGGVPGTPLVIILLVSVFLLVFAYPALFEALWRGRTPGKAAFGLRVVTNEGAPIGFRHAAIRSALSLVDDVGLFILGPVPGIVSIFLSSSNQRLGDVVAGTIVLRERSGARAPTAMVFPMPAGCEAYAATLDVAGVGSEDYTTVRSFLLRAPSLPFHLRGDLARQLASPMAARLRHTPPPWVTPELFLAVVVAKVQLRGARPLSPAPTADWGVAPARPVGVDAQPWLAGGPGPAVGTPAGLGPTSGRPLTLPAPPADGFAVPR